MYEKVSPAHFDKKADRIAGAIVDIAYRLQKDPRVAVEVLLGHGHCYIIIESSVDFDDEEIIRAIERIAGSGLEIEIIQSEQDPILAENQAHGFRCGDNGIFRGMPVTDEQRKLTTIAREIYAKYPFDGKCILDGDRLVICQSNVKTEDLKKEYPTAEINPLGDWTGGPNVDSGATNRKLGSDMGDSATGGGIFGKDLSKADVSVNIYAWLKAQIMGGPVELSCAIGDTQVDGRPYSEIVEIARNYIDSIGGFEAFATWGLIR